MTKMAVNIAGIEFKNPIIVASGTFGFGREYNELYPISILGGISSKGLTLEARQGNDYPRIAETPSGILNSVGLQNPGVEHFIAKDLEWLKMQDTVVIANVAGHSIEDYVNIAKRLSDTNVDMLELNISCPNVAEGGMAFGVKPNNVEEITRLVKAVCKKPLIVKLTPNVEDITQNALAAERGGADAISLINTIGGMSIDYKTRKPILANIVGGLSGPAVKPIALKMVHMCYNAVRIPIIGMGGITNYTDVLDFMICGASAVQVGTANITNPMAAYQIVKDLEEYITNNDLDINTLVGSLIV